MEPTESFNTFANLDSTSVLTCSSCNLRWPSLLKVNVEFRGLQAQISSLSQHLWRNGLAYKQLHEQWEQSCIRITEANTKLEEARETLQALEVEKALREQELSVTKDSLSHEFRLLQGHEEDIRLQRDTVHKLVVVLNKLVSPKELANYYGVLLPDDFELGTILQTNEDLLYQHSATRQNTQDLMEQLDDKAEQISALQQELEDRSSALLDRDSEIGALRQELSQYCNEEDVEFGTAMLGKRKRMQ
ncbi:MAG: hypothetical protein Q9168_001721 [Polycauliona sp. 1 TL-2023]